MTATVNKNIPEAYKQTEIGMIPEDWEIRKCVELGSFYKGKGISSRDLVSDGLPCIMYGDIYVKFDTKFSNPDFRITEQTAAKSSLAKEGDLFFTGSGETAEEIGKCIVYQGKEDIYIGGDIIALTPNSSVDSLFLAYIQNSEMLLSQKANLGQGYTVVHIYTENIKSLKVPLPPTKKEQTAIATTLSDVDEVIEKLEKLIEKKKNIKKGIMQELLTGIRRLPGFSDRWEIRKLGNIFRVTRGQVLAMTRTTEERIGEYHYPVYSSQTKNNGLAGYYKDYLFENCITWTTDGANAGDVKYRAGKFYCTNVCGVLENKEGYSNLCVAEIFNSISKKYVSYVGNPKLMNNVVADIEVLIPSSIKEQNVLALIISDMDSEIEKLESQLLKYKNIKQGMMQNLLTGKIRLLKKQYGDTTNE